MRIRVVRAFRGYKRGQVFEWPDGMANILVARGMIEKVPEGEVELAALEQRSEKAVITSSRKKK